MGTHGVVQRGNRDLYAEFCIELNGGCPVSTLDKPVEQIRVQIAGGMCHADLVIGGPERHVEHMNIPTGPQCVGTIFADFDCVPNVLSLEDARMTVGVFLPSVATLPEIIDELEVVCDRVLIRRFVSFDSDRCAPVMIDLTRLTEKERDTIRLAVEAGYFEGSEVTLSDIASVLGLSEGAVSRRIKSAKGALLSQFCSDST